MSKKNDSTFGGWSGCLCVFLFIAGAVILLLDYVIARDALQQWRTSNYLETAGTIRHSKIRIVSGGEGSSIHIEIHYDYTINDERYTSEVYRFLQRFVGERKARQIIAEFPVGKVVPVYYDSAQPQRAVLCKGLDLQDSTFLFFLIPFNGILLIGGYGLFNSKCRRLFRNEERWLRDFPIQNDELTLRLKISLFPTVPAAIIGTFPACFVAMFIPLLGLPDTLVFSLCYGGLVLGGLYGFWLAMRWNRSGVYDLVVDKFHGEMILPRQPDKTPGPVVPFDAIEDIEYSTVAAKSNDDRDEHVLTLHYRNGNSTESAIVVSKHNWIDFLHFTEGNTEEELTALKHWILRETSRQTDV